MKSNNIKDLNTNEKTLFKKKVKIIKLNKKSKEKSFFSQSLYLSKFLNMNRTKKSPGSTKFMQSSSLLISKHNKLITKMKKTIKNPKNIQLLDLNKISVHNSLNSLNSIKTLKHSSQNTNTFKDNDENDEKGIIYEDNIKLKTKINRLKIELFLLKSLNKRKDEEIKELNKYLEDAKSYNGKKDKNIFLQKIKSENIIIKLRDCYENIKLKMREKNNINRAIIKKMKGIDISELIRKNEDETKILKDKFEVLKFKNDINEEIQKKLNQTNWKRQRYLDNYDYLNNLKIIINQKLIKVDILSEKAYKLRNKYYEKKSQKSQILRHNHSIKNKNEELLLDKKYMQDFIIKKAEIEQKILKYTIKSKDLFNKVKSDEYSIKSFLNEQNVDNANYQRKNEFYEYIPQLENNPNENTEKQVLLYESLINESKKRQKNLVKLLNNVIENTTNNNTNNQNIDDNSKIFDEKNFDINDINIEYNGEKQQNADLQFLLNVMFYIKNIQKEKIERILLNFKTENYYIGDLNEKDNFIEELSIDILNSINNKKDVDNLKEILNYLFQNKYKSNKILFLNKIINDIYILDDKNKMLFIKEQENFLFNKLRNLFSNKISSINKKIKSLQVKKILYEKLKSIFTEEKLYNKTDKEKIKLFQFFICVIKKREISTAQNNALNEFSTKDIINFLCDLEEEIIYHNNFFKALKSFLEEKNMNLNEFIGIKKVIDISEFIDILNENQFEINDDSFDLKIFLQKYKIEENSENISIELIKKDLDKISNF